MSECRTVVVIKIEMSLAPYGRVTTPFTRIGGVPGNVKKYRKLVRKTKAVLLQNSESRNEKPWTYRVELIKTESRLFMLLIHHYEVYV